jgi:hypothetical protein
MPPINSKLLAFVITPLMAQRVVEILCTPEKRSARRAEIISILQSCDRTPTASSPNITHQNFSNSNSQPSVDTAELRRS